MFDDEFESKYDAPDYDYDGPYFDDEPDRESGGTFIGGQWVDVDDLPQGYGKGPDWWDDSCGESFEEYMEHTD